MELWHIVVLAVIQGLTEFLPISSSAHLILPSALLGWQDQGLAFDVAVFEALWQDGQDIGDEDLLVDLAEDAGVDGDEIRSALADDALRSTVREKFTAAKRQGITGVPTFAYDGHAARGAVPPEQLERLVDGT